MAMAQGTLHDDVLARHIYLGRYWIILDVAQLLLPGFQADWQQDINCNYFHVLWS